MKRYKLLFAFFGTVCRSQMSPERRRSFRQTVDARIEPDDHFPETAERLYIQAQFNDLQ